MNQALQGDAPAAPPSLQPGIPPRTRVWVIDDDPVVMLYLTELLRHEGFDPLGFTDPLQALATFFSAPTALDVLLTDQRMPGLRGDALARAMRTLRPGLRVLLCTGYADATDEAGARAAGVTHFLRKPFDSAELLRALRGEPPATDGAG